MRKRRATFIAAAILSAIIAAPAHATAGGVPTAIFVIPAGWLLFIVALPIEAIVAKRILRLKWSKAFSISLSANAVSMIAGIPLATIALGMIGSGLVHPEGGGVGWIFGYMIYVPIEGEMGPDWAFYGAMSLLCAAYFAMSILSEKAIVVRMVPDEVKKRTGEWAWWANGITYGLPFIASVVMAIVTAK